MPADGVRTRKNKTEELKGQIQEVDHKLTRNKEAIEELKGKVDSVIVVPVPPELA